MAPCEIRSANDVLALWRKADRVPLRTEGRENCHEDRYCLGVYLMALAAHGLLDYPLGVKQGESPDFMLTLTSGETIGVEVTRATEESFQRQVTSGEREWQRRRIEAEQKGEEPELVVVPLSRDGWTEGEADRQWCDMVRRAIEKKVAKLPKFRPASRYDLVIHDDTPLLGIDRERVLSALAPRCSDLKSKTPKLGRISIVLTQDVLFDVGGESRVLFQAERSALETLGSSDSCD